MTSEEPKNGEVAFAAVFDHRAVFLHDGDLRAGQLLHVGESAGVIGVAVAVDDPFDVLGLESEFLDGIDDDWAGVWRPGVEENVTLGGHEKP